MCKWWRTNADTLNKLEEVHFLKRNEKNIREHITHRLKSKWDPKDEKEKRRRKGQSPRSTYSYRGY